MSELSRTVGALTTGGSAPSQQQPQAAAVTSQQSSTPPAAASSTPPQQQAASSSTPPAPAATSSTPPPAQNPPPSSSTPPPAAASSSSSSSPPPPAAAPSSSTPPAAPPSSSSTPPAAAPAQPTTTSPNAVPVPGTTAPGQQNPGTPVVTVTPSNSVTTIEVITAIKTSPGGPANSASSASASSSSTPAAINPGGDGGGGGISQPAQVAIGVVVPIAAIALLALVGLWWWRKRKARQQSEEERRKEVEDYAYNPNAGPTAPAVGLADSYEMRDGEAGYRGWGNTPVAGSTGRKASTTMSGGMTAATLSDGGDVNGNGHTRGNLSDGKADSHFTDSSSPDGGILGAMGPSAAANRNGDVRRGPSNASSSYSATGRSEGSDGGMFPNGGGYYDQYAQNPYCGTDQQAQEASGPAVIRDNPARRSTRIENPSHYPQQSAGIAQNF
ncbi:hypothetical protein E4U30_005176 [Claviceps sp. LM220 group G6]|nr:hypothetical protein E4U15_005086 [Claviceps sp. LM218 group G6]KAG6092647.1 hypothetical protein E4U30_005176 [Claviceps sp. LM220 group G6]KAG6113995.1 hypothetical protein E4U31_007143 [Claviceps sp. LM219 group G6]KAG6122338.1 hypothetical protein E4U14_007804 [Claviceps sp. LM454 group G7]